MANENPITIAPELWKRLEGAVSGRRVLKALSVRQPFANLIADGEQDHRGPAPRHNPPRSPADCFQQAPGRAGGWVLLSLW